MEVGESRNKRYVNPRNGAVYSSHKKANKIFFRSGKYTPEPSSVLIPRFRSLPLNSFLPPEKWQKINRRWDKECETWPGMKRGRTSFALRFPVIHPRDDGFSEAERNRSTYCPELISRLPRLRTNRILFFIGVASCADTPYSLWFSCQWKRVTNEMDHYENFRETRENVDVAFL